MEAQTNLGSNGLFGHSNRPVAKLEPEEDHVEEGIGEDVVEDVRERDNEGRERE